MAEFIDIEINGKFFSNDYIVLGKESVDRIISLSDTRPNPLREFKAPRHTIGTKSLLIFLNGKLQALGVDYIDKTSDSIEFLRAIDTTAHYESILIADTGIAGDGGKLEWEEF